MRRTRTQLDYLLGLINAKSGKSFTLLRNYQGYQLVLDGGRRDTTNGDFLTASEMYYCLQGMFYALTQI